MKTILIALLLTLSLLLVGCGTTLSGLIDRDEPEESPGRGDVSAGHENTTDSQENTDNNDNTDQNEHPDGNDGSQEGSEDVSVFPFSFIAQDLHGNTVTEADIGDREIFFVHFWATWCPPCIAEMPELGEIVEMYSDRVGFFGLLDDYDTSRDVALSIKESSNASFLNVDAHNEDLRDLLGLVQSGFVPTTILIDSDGNIIGRQIIGAFGLGYADFIEAALQR